MKEYRKAIVLFGIIVIAGILYSCSGGEESGGTLELSTEKELETEQVSGESAEITQTGRKLYVFITGCVLNPGVYEMNDGARLFELIEAAGGFTQEADEDYLNLAQYLTDGDKVIVYSTEETAAGLAQNQMTSENQASSHSVEEDGKVNLNRADKNMLMTLPGIGEAKADAIIQYRTQQGEFSDATEIMKIPGIKEGAFDKIKDLITV